MEIMTKYSQIGLLSSGPYNSSHLKKFWLIDWLIENFWNTVIIIKLDGQGRARREAARRRKAEWKVNLGNGNSSRSNDS